MSLSYKYELYHKPLRDGTKQVVLRITFKRETKRLGTTIFTEEDYWAKRGNAQNGEWITKKNELHRVLNDRLKEKLRKVEKALDALEKSKVPITIASISDFILRAWANEPLQPHVTIGLLINEEIKIYEGQQSRIDYYERLLTNVNRHNLANTSIEDFDFGKLKAFEIGMLKKLSPGYVAKQLSVLKSVFLKAQKNHLITPENNPFSDFKIKRNHVVIRGKLTFEEIKAMEKIALPPQSSLWHSRNVFLMQYYCAGSRVGDILQLKWKNVKNGLLVFSMQKTDQIRRITLPKKALDLLDLYPHTNLEDYIFPFIKKSGNLKKYYKQITGGPVATINADLKDIAKMLDFRIRLTTHIARHTFADHARQRGNDVFEIKKALGHTKLNVTEGYLQNLNDGDISVALSFIDKD